MDVGKVISARLNGHTGAEERCYPLFLPQSPDYPAVSYFQVSATPTHAMGQDVNLWRIRVQVDAWAKSYADARTLANEIRGQLSRYRGTIDDVTVLDCFMDDEEEMYEPDAELRRVSSDWTLLVKG